jgi:uncharacterized protein (DUF58 family)
MRRTRICLEGWCYLVLVGFIVGGAMIREINLLLFLAGIMIGPLVLSWRLLVRMLARISVDRQLPHGVGAGERFPVKLLVSNKHRRLGVWGLIINHEIRRRAASPDWPAKTSTTFFPYIGPGQRASQNYDCRIHDRGAYEFGRLQISSRFPMGLIKRTLVMAAPATVYVYPRLGRLRRKWIEFVQPSQLGNQRSQHRPGLTEGEFHSLRDWRNGDSRRWIHWRTTARRNQLTVRQFERRQNRNLAVLLELRSDRPTSDELERAVQFVATVVAHHCRTGSSHLLLGIAGESVEIATGFSSAGLMQDCMEILATAIASQNDRFPELLDQALCQIDPQTRVFVVSTHAIHLSDTTRFASVWDQPEKRPLLSRIRCIEATVGQLDPYFTAAARPISRGDSHVVNEPGNRQSETTAHALSTGQGNGEEGTPR